MSMAGSLLVVFNSGRAGEELEHFVTEGGTKPAG